MLPQAISTWFLGISDPSACMASLLLTEPSLTILSYNWKKGIIKCHMFSVPRTKLWWGHSRCHNHVWWPITTLTADSDSSVQGKRKPSAQGEAILHIWKNNPDFFFLIFPLMCFRFSFHFKYLNPLCLHFLARHFEREFTKYRCCVQTAHPGSCWKGTHLISRRDKWVCGPGKRASNMGGDSSQPQHQDRKSQHTQLTPAIFKTPFSTCECSPKLPACTRRKGSGWTSFLKHIANVTIKSHILLVKEWSPCHITTSPRQWQEGKGHKSSVMWAWNMGEKPLWIQP